MKKLMFAAALVASAAAFADGPINAVSFAGGVNDYQFNTQGALFYFDGESDSSTVTNEPAELILPRARYRGRHALAFNQYN